MVNQGISNGSGVTCSIDDGDAMSPGSPVTSSDSGGAEILDSELFNLPVLPSLFGRGSGGFEFGESDVVVGGMEEGGVSVVDDGFFGPLVNLDCGFEIGSLSVEE